MFIKALLDIGCDVNDPNVSVSMIWHRIIQVSGGAHEVSSRLIKVADMPGTFSRDLAAEISALCSSASYVEHDNITIIEVAWRLCSLKLVEQDAISCAYVFLLVLYSDALNGSGIRHMFDLWFVYSYYRSEIWLRNRVALQELSLIVWQTRLKYTTCEDESLSASRMAWCLVLMNHQAMRVKFSGVLRSALESVKSFVEVETEEWEVDQQRLYKALYANIAALMSVA